MTWIDSVRHSEAPVMPAIVTASPRCVIVMPQAERGRPTARRTLVPNGARPRPMRPASSVSVAVPSQAAAAMPRKLPIE